MNKKNDKSEDLEKNLNFINAGYKDLQTADKSKDISKKINYFMKAARSFEIAQPWRLAYYCWRSCGDGLLSMLENQNCEKPQIKFVQYDEVNLVDRFSTYGATDDNWENPAKKTYLKHLGRNASEEEKIKHRLAWIYDFAAQTASRNNDYANASEMNRKAANCWATCTSFPKYQIIAVKFFTYAACERILAIGRKNFLMAERDVQNDISNIT